MKTYFLKFFLLLATIITFTNCNEDDINPNNTVSGGTGLIGFENESETFLLPTATTSEELNIGLDSSVKSGTDRNVQVEFNADLSENITSDMITSITAMIPANSYNGEAVVQIDNSMIETGVIYTLVLDLVSAGEGAVLNGAKDQVVVTINKCFNESFPIDFSTVPLTYSCRALAFNSEAPSHEQTLTLLYSDASQAVFSTGSAWGPNFVGWATGNSAYNGLYLYGGNITIYQNGTVDFVGAYGSSVESGTYDPCSGVIDFTIDQALFTTAFTIQCIYTPN